MAGRLDERLVAQAQHLPANHPRMVSQLTPPMPTNNTSTLAQPSGLATCL